MLSLGQLYTDNTNADDNDNNADNANNDENDTQRTNHDCIGSLACMPNEPKNSRNEIQYGTHLNSGTVFVYFDKLEMQVIAQSIDCKRHLPVCMLK